MKLKVAGIAAAIGSAYGEYFLEETISDEIAEADYASFNSGYGPYVGIFDGGAAGVHVLTSSWFNGSTVHIPLTFLSEAYSDFGRNIDLAGNTETGDMLWVGTDDAAAFIFRGEWNKWSVQQTLTPPDDYNVVSTSFGFTVDVDRQDFHTAVVGCPTCDCEGCSADDSNFDTGQIFVYEATSKDAKSWTATQMLESRQEGDISSCIDNPKTEFTFQLGKKARVSGDNIIASAEYSYCNVGGFVLFRKYGKTWSQTQTFWSDEVEVLEAEIENDTLFLTAEDTVVDGKANVGAVYIHYPNTAEYGTKPKPKPKSVPQWSLHQILYPPEPIGFDLFGSDLSIDGNRALVGATNASKVFVYEREELAGMWSLQQILEPTYETEYYTDNALSGTKAFGIGGAPAGPPLIDMYSEDVEWDCLVIAVEDQFGDGWDVARLEIESPDHIKQSFAQHCHFDNAFQFRYCPASADAGGLYKLRIVDAPKSKFFWEIQWRVYEEKSGKWFQGKHDTNMDFHFDPKKLEMTHRAIKGDLPTNITCHSCPTEPKPKPKGKAKGKSFDSRELHSKSGKGSTAAPSISPAPTLAQSLVEDWQYLDLSTTDSAWFDVQHRGTNYYISDSKGRRLFATGTMCGTEPVSCYADIPDGSYILRVSGDLDVGAGDHQWAFCGRVGGAGEQLDFVVKDNECTPVASLTTFSYCSDVLGCTVEVASQLVMLGIPSTTPLSQLSKADLDTFANGVSGLIDGVSPNGVKLVDIYSENDHAVFSVKITVDGDVIGTDAHDMESIESAATYVSNKLSSAAETGQLWQAVASATTEGSTFFHAVSGVSYMSTDLSKVTTFMPEVSEAVNEVVDVASTRGGNLQSAAAEDNTETSSTFVAGLAGYALAGIALVAVAFVTVGPSVRAAIAPATLPEDSESVSTKKESMTSKPVPVVDSTKKSVAMNALMMADLVKMAQEEDEHLAETMKSDHFKL